MPRRESAVAPPRPGPARCQSQSAVRSRPAARDGDRPQTAAPGAGPAAPMLAAPPGRTPRRDGQGTGDRLDRTCSRGPSSPPPAPTGPATRACDLQTRPRPPLRGAGARRQVVPRRPPNVLKVRTQKDARYLRDPLHALGPALALSTSSPQPAQRALSRRQGRGQLVQVDVFQTLRPGVQDRQEPMAGHRAVRRLRELRSPFGGDGLREGRVELLAEVEAREEASALGAL